MKQIQAIIRPEKLDSVKDALVELGINGITTSTVQGFGRQLGHTEVYRGVKVEARFLPKVMIFLIVNDDKVAATVDAVRTAAQTGEVGDGKIVVLPVEDAIRIRTGEKGSDVVA